MSKVEVVDKPVTLTIDGVSVVAKANETILEAAKKHGIYIPTLCYLPKLKPIASCRICVVEVEGANGFVLSCQTPVVEGIKVTTNSEALYKERQNIMKLYDVNHPLECGVCDKSGECELQNKTLEFGVDAQEFAAREQKRDLKNWGLISYDESLCILCERCVHICNEIIGDDAIEISTGGYKSKIVPKSSCKKPSEKLCSNGSNSASFGASILSNRAEGAAFERATLFEPVLDCTFCGECIAVCPVGALISTNFKYTSNAWELNKIPARCAHCSSACELNYEVKHNTTLTGNDEKIYRVTNEFAESSLCGAGRFGFDFESGEQSCFERAIEAFEAADTILFDSYITNEEARILQKMKEIRGYKLINPDALAFKRFMEAFSKSSGDTLYNGTLDDVKSCDFALVIGSYISSDNPMVRYALTNARQKRGAQVVVAHPIEDPLLKSITVQQIRYEVGTEEGVLALIAKALIKEQPGTLNKLDTGYISAESNVGEEEIAKLAKKINNSKRRVLILGADLYNHKRAREIAKIAGAIQRFTDIRVLIIPSQTNTLGVSQICDLDDSGGSYAIGYNKDANFRLNMPPLSAQEGTFVNIDKRVVPTNSATAYKGYTLNCIAKALGVSSRKYTIEFTKEIFNKVDFDEIPLNGYALTNQKTDATESIDGVAELPEYNGTIVYLANPVLQFSKYSATSKLLPKDSELVGSAQFAVAAKINDGDGIEINLGGKTYKTRFKLDKMQKGTIAILPLFDKEELGAFYRYQKCEIIKR